MNLFFPLTTARLLIQPLTPADNHFIFELVNTDGWLKFIGNRNVASAEEATAYIQKILAMQHVVYWVVKLKDTEEATGIVTYIQRDYLPYPDIGFAFLPRYCKQGYAYEATNAVLHQLTSEQQLTHILATTLSQNAASIKLLEKLGLNFEKEMEVEHQKLHIYGASTETFLQQPITT